MNQNRSDTMIRHDGMKLLLDNLGKVDAERFICLMMREPFDYTKWQENLFEDMTLDELGKKAMDYYTQNNS